MVLVLETTIRTKLVVASIWQCDGPLTACVVFVLFVSLLSATGTTLDALHLQRNKLHLVHPAAAQSDFASPHCEDLRRKAGTSGSRCQCPVRPGILQIRYFALHTKHLHIVATVGIASDFSVIDHKFLAPLLGDVDTSSWSTNRSSRRRT